MSDRSIYLRDQAPDRAALRRWCVAIISRNPDLGARNEFLELAELILGESFGWKQIHHPRSGLGKAPLDGGKVVTQRFAAVGAGYDHHILARHRQVIGVSLVRVKLLQTQLVQPIPKLVVHRHARRCQMGFSRFENFRVGDLRG